MGMETMSKMSDSGVVDKGAETRRHIQEVQLRLFLAVEDLENRAALHDASKLEEPELSGFWEMNAISQRKDVEYGTPEYKALMDSQKPVIHHHYRMNDHHPEHYRFNRPLTVTFNPEYSRTGLEMPGRLIACMTLPSLIEMLCDWDAAAGRYKDGSFAKSYRANVKRFGISEQLASICLKASTSTLRMQA